MGLFDSELGIKSGGTATIQPQTGGIFGDVLSGKTTQPKEPTAIEGTKKLGESLISGIGGAITNWGKRFATEMNKPSQNWGDVWNKIKVSAEPALELGKGIVRAPIELVETPALSAAQGILETGKKLGIVKQGVKPITEFSLPVLGKFQSYQQQQKELQPQFGKAVSYGFPIANLILDYFATKGAVKLPEATAKSPVEQFLGNEAKNVDKVHLGVWNEMTKNQAALDALKSENPAAVNVSKISQQQALQAIKERAKTITPQEHMAMITQIAKNIGETPSEIAKSLPNYLKKYGAFQKALPEISQATGIAPEKLTLLRNDTLTDVDIDNIIKDIRRIKWTEKAKAPDFQYKTAVGYIYKKYPGLRNYQSVLEPDTTMTTRGADGLAYDLKSLGADQLLPESMRMGSNRPLQSQLLSPLKGKADLIDRLNYMKSFVNKEVPTTNLPQVSEVLKKIAQESPTERGYKVGFSPLDYAPIIPKDEVPLPKQNWLGKVVDNLGLRGVSREQINFEWQKKFEQIFNSQFSTGVKAKNGTIYDLSLLQPMFKKSGVSYLPEGKDNILDLLWRTAQANNRFSITELSINDLSTLFEKADAQKLASVLRQSRVLPASLEGTGVNIVNRLRTNKWFDDFYRFTVAGHFNYSPSFGLRHFIKNQILGAFEGKPVNMLKFANNKLGNYLIRKIPRFFGGEIPTASELYSLKEILGGSKIMLDPASEAYVYSPFSHYYKGDAPIELADAAVREAIKSPNWFEQFLGYTQTQDVVDLSRSFAKKMGTTIEEIKFNSELSQQLKDLVEKTYSYKKGFLTSPAISTMNTILYPIRFDAKVIANTTKWWLSKSIMTRSAIATFAMDGIRNSNTPEAKKFLKDHATMVRALTYIVPYFNFLNLWADTMKTIGDISVPTKIPSDLYRTITDNFYVGGLMFGLLTRMAQDQGIIPQTQYVSPAGKKSSQFIPQGFLGRAKMFLADLIGHLWPGGNEIIGILPGGIGTETKKLLPTSTKYLPKGEHKKIRPETSATFNLVK